MKRPRDQRGQLLLLGVLDLVAGGATSVVGVRPCMLAR